MVSGLAAEIGAWADVGDVLAKGRYVGTLYE